MKYSSRSSSMDMESRAVNFEEGTGSLPHGQGGDLVPGVISLAKTSAPSLSEAPATYTSLFFVPDPCLGDCSTWAGSDRAGECAGEVVSVGDLAGSSSNVGSSTSTFVGEGTAAAGDAQAGEPGRSTKIAVAL